MRGEGRKTDSKIELIHKMDADFRGIGNEYLIDGKKIAVTSRFIGEKDLRELILELAVLRAKREMGL